MKVVPFEFKHPQDKVVEVMMESTGDGMGIRLRIVDSYGNSAVGDYLLDISKSGIHLMAGISKRHGLPLSDTGEIKLC